MKDLGKRRTNVNDFAKQYFACKAKGKNKKPYTYKVILLVNLFLTGVLLSRFSRVRLCATPWTAAYQAPPSMGFSRQEYWSGLPLPSPVTA